MLDEDGFINGPKWVVACWIIRTTVEIGFVRCISGQVRPDVGCTAQLQDAYIWNSYHAARKYWREHPELAGYEILNLDTILKQSRLHARVKADMLREKYQERQGGKQEAAKKGERANNARPEP